MPDNYWFVVADVRTDDGDALHGAVYAPDNL